MSSKGKYMWVRMSENGSTYFQAGDVRGYLPGITDGNNKRILYEVADSIGVNDPGVAVMSILHKLGINIELAGARVLAEEAGLLKFEDAFRQVILKLHELDKPFLTLYVQGYGKGDEGK